MSFSRLLPPITIVLVGLATYATGFLGDFVFDDDRAIVKNEAVRQLQPPVELLQDPNLGITRPFVLATLQWDRAWGGVSPFPFHVTNITIHLLAGWLLYALCRRAFRSPALVQRWGESADGLALAIALVWVVHPLQTQSVTYLIQRCESLAGLWVLVTLWATARGADSPRWGSLWYGLALLASVAACLSKENVAAIPLVTLLYDRAFLAGSFTAALRRRFALYFGLFACWGILFALIHRASGAIGIQYETIAPVSPWHYFLTQTQVLWYYLRLSVAPYPLVLDYGWPIVTNWHTVWLEFTSMFALGLIALWSMVQRPALGFILAWFFLFLAPTSSFWPIPDACMEHRMYLPLIAVVSLGVLVVDALLSWLLPRLDFGPVEVARTKLGLLVAIVAVFGLMTALRNLDYRSPETLYRAALKVRPSNPRVHYNYGVYMVRQRRFGEACRQFDATLEIAPDHLQARIVRAFIWMQEGRLEEAGREIDRTLDQMPYVYDGFYTKGLHIAKSGNITLGRQWMERAVNQHPHAQHLHIGLANLCLVEGDVGAATQRFLIAKQLGPSRDLEELENIIHRVRSARPGSSGSTKPP